MCCDYVLREEKTKRGVREHPSFRAGNQPAHHDLTNTINPFYAYYENNNNKNGRCDV